MVKVSDGNRRTHFDLFTTDVVDLFSLQVFRSCGAARDPERKSLSQIKASQQPIWDFTDSLPDSRFFRCRALLIICTTMPSASHVFLFLFVGVRYIACVI